jgi:hypothetical protein
MHLTFNSDGKYFSSDRKNNIILPYKMCMGLIKHICGLQAEGLYLQKCLYSGSQTLLVRVSFPSAHKNDLKFSFHFIFLSWLFSDAVNKR